MRPVESINVANFGAPLSLCLRRIHDAFVSSCITNLILISTHRLSSASSFITAPILSTLSHGPICSLTGASQLSENGRNIITINFAPTTIPGTYRCEWARSTIQTP